MAEATPRWSGVSYVEGESASLPFDVIAAANPFEASAAVPFQAGSSCPWDGSLFAKSPQVDENGFNCWLVTCNFTPPDGQGNKPREQNPLDEPPMIRWSFSNSSEPFDRDIHGHPYENTALEPFAQPFHKDVMEVEFFIRRNFAEFDANINQFCDTVNESDISMSDGKKTYTFAAGTLRFLCANPTIEYNGNTPYIPVEGYFKWRKDGWRVRTKNQGRMGWCMFNGVVTRGPLCYGRDCNPISEDVPLHLDGTPLDETLRVSATAMPVPSPHFISGDIEFEQGDDGTLWLLHDQYPKADFHQLPF